MRGLICSFSIWMLCAACGPKLPPRYVIEKDLDDYRYRRHQTVLDVEVPIPGNPAVGHTATYVRGGSSVHIAPVFVSAYEHATGLTETVRQHLRAMDTYTFDTREVEGEHVWRLRGQAGDNWLVWVSDKHVIKLGAPEGETEVPEPIVEAYLDRYPSDLDERGRAKDGASSAGAAVQSGAPQANAEP